MEIIQAIEKSHKMTDIKVGDWIVRTSGKPFGHGKKAIKVEKLERPYTAVDFETRYPPQRNKVNDCYDIEYVFTKKVTEEEALKINEDYIKDLRWSIEAEKKAKAKREAIHKAHSDKDAAINKNPHCWNRLKRKPKMKFDTESEAIAWMRKYFSADKNMNAYICPSCGKWHFGRVLVKDSDDNKESNDIDDNILTKFNDYYGTAFIYLLIASVVNPMIFVLGETLIQKTILSISLFALLVIGLYIKKDRLINNEDSEGELDSEEEW